MKTKLLPSSALFLSALASLVAAPLTVTTAVHTKPDLAAPAISFLKAGTEPIAAAGASAPDDWMAVALPGPFEGYVENKDLTKSLDVKPGTSIRLAPKAEAGVLAVAEAGDKATITGLRGRWTQISLEKTLVGFIRLSGPSAGLPLIATTPAMPPSGAPPSAPAASTTTAPGQPAPSAEDGTSSLPRQFVGKFVSTRRALAPRRPYDYALNDSAGKRYAYLDISKLLLTEQIEAYLDRNVAVFGTARNTADGKEIVVTVETLQLK